jgi:hypothetical protein
MTGRDWLIFIVIAAAVLAAMTWAGTMDYHDILAGRM